MEEKKLTGYPSTDKPWLKYYTKEAIERKLVPNTIYGYLWEQNKEHLNDVALVYFQQKISFQKLFQDIEQCAKSLTTLSVKPGDIENFESYEQPIEYRFIAELPRTKLSKVDYRALEREAQKEMEI